MSATIMASDKGAPRRTLGFFFSYGGSLTKWEQEGILSREVRVLEAYLDQGLVDEVVMFSYDKRDTQLIHTLRETRPAFARIEVLVPKGLLSRRPLYSLLGPILHRRALAQATVLRTNQVSGSWSAVIAKWVTGRPLVVRLGYILSRRHRLNGQAGRARVSGLLERLAFANADAVIVTSELAAGAVKSAVGDGGKVHLVPTYIDIDTFVAKTTYDFSRPLLYVGRMTPQKNLPNLIRACGRMGQALHIVGSGEQEEELAHLARETGCPLTFLGRIDNEKLAVLMQDYTIFVLPSLHEGLPKALIEAMGSGMICVGTNVPGTSDIITDGVDGYLADDTSTEAIEAALSRALAEQRTELGRAARESVLRRYSLQVYMNSEAAVLSTLPTMQRGAPRQPVKVAR